MAQDRTAGGVLIRLRILICLLFGGFLAGFVVAPSAFAASANSGWTFIGTTPYSCGYYRNSIHNSDYKAMATTRNVTYYSGYPCAPSNGLTQLPDYYLSVSAKLIDQNTNHACGSSGTVYNTSYASLLQVEVFYVGLEECYKHRGDIFTANGSGSRYNEYLSGYQSSGAVQSPGLSFN